jgi:hypothetical protein
MCRPINTRSGPPSRRSARPYTRLDKHEACRLDKEFDKNPAEAIVLSPYRSSALLKRAVDLLLSLALTLAAAPLFLLVVLLVELTSPGPAIYRQTAGGPGCLSTGVAQRREVGGGFGPTSYGCAAPVGKQPSLSTFTEDFVNSCPGAS